MIVFVLVVFAAVATEALEAGPCWNDEETRPFVAAIVDTPAAEVTERAATITEWTGHRVARNRWGETSNCTRLRSEGNEAGTRTVSFTVDCVPLPGWLTCVAWRELVLQSLAFVLAWVNANSVYDREFEDVSLAEVDREPLLTFRFDRLERPSLLGLATRRLVRLNLDADYGLESLRTAGERMRLDITAPYRPCAYDLRDVLLHEVFHALGLGHCDNMDSLMWPTARPNRRLPQGYFPSRTGGFHVIDRDVYHLRRVWNRTNVLTMDERLNDESLWRAYDRLRRDKTLPVLDATSTTTPQTTTTTTTTTKKPLQQTRLNDILARYNRHDSTEREKLFRRVRSMFDDESFAARVLKRLARRRPDDEAWEREWNYDYVGDLLADVSQALNEKKRQ